MTHRAENEGNVNGAFVDLDNSTKLTSSLSYALIKWRYATIIWLMIPLQGVTMKPLSSMLLAGPSPIISTEKGLKKGLISGVVMDCWKSGR